MYETGRHKTGFRRSHQINLAEKSMNRPYQALKYSSTHMRWLETFCPGRHPAIELETCAAAGTFDVLF